MKKIILVFIMINLIGCTIQSQSKVKYQQYNSDIPQENLKFKDGNKIYKQLEKISSEKSFDDTSTKFIIDDFEIELVLYEKNIGIATLFLTFDIEQAKRVVGTINKIQTILNLNEINDKDFISLIDFLDSNKKNSNTKLPFELQKVNKKIYVIYKTYV